MAYQDPSNRRDRENKTRFTEADYAVIQWWANQFGVSVAQLVRQCTLERLAQLAVSKEGGQEGRAA